jgi:hypothetical protein
MVSGDEKKGISDFGSDEASFQTSLPHFCFISFSFRFPLKILLSTSDRKVGFSC